MSNNITINGYTLIKTCGACPEQYDVYLGETQVGYLRLRHGHFSVACPDCGGKVVYQSSANGDGAFEDEERDMELNAAVEAIDKWVGHEMCGDK